MVYNIFWVDIDWEKKIFMEFQGIYLLMNKETL